MNGNEMHVGRASFILLRGCVCMVILTWYMNRHLTERDVLEVTASVKFAKLCKMIFIVHVGKL